MDKGTFDSQKRDEGLPNIKTSQPTALYCCDLRFLLETSLPYKRAVGIESRFLLVCFEIPKLRIDGPKVNDDRHYKSI